MKRATVIVGIFLALTSLAASGQQPQTCTIQIQARLYERWGPDAIPPNREFYILLTRRTFYLLDADADTLIRGLKHPELATHVHGEDDKAKGGPGAAAFLYAMNASERGFSGGSAHLRQFYEQANAILRPHFIQKVETDGEGKAAFQPVTTGMYYIIGDADDYPQQWNLKVEAKPPTIRVVLGDFNRIGAEPGRVERSTSN